MKDNSVKEKKRYKRRLLWRFLKGSKLLFTVSILSTALFALADMLSPQIVRVAVDNVILRQPAELPGAVTALIDRFGGFEGLRENIWIMALAVLIVAAVRVGAQYVFRVANTEAAETLVKTMRDSLFAHIERLPFSWHVKNRTGDIIQRCTSDIDTMKLFVSEQMTSIFRIVILVALSVCFMLSMDRGLTLIAVLPAPFIIIYSFYFNKKIGAAFLDCDENEGKLSAMAQENLTGVRVVRAFGRERYEKDRFEAHNQYYTGLWVRLAKTMSMYWSSADIMSGIQILLVTVFGAVFCLRGRLTPGEYMVFISYASMLTWPIRALGRMISEMSKAGVSIDRIAYIMASEEERDSPGALEPAMDGDIEFDHVSFAYENCPEIIHDVSFKVPAGTTLGILGGTGSGKSTLMLLLDKLYDLPPESGHIRIGGADIAGISTAHLRKNVGIVLQEPFLFSRTIAENLRIGDASLSDEALREAARAACLDETIESFTHGYDTVVGERGVTLSGGQKQRAAIARMLTRKTPIMIFDDSLSAVDTETDAKIRASLEARFGSASIILISHRITTLSKADNIIVLDRGRVAEQGSHDELKSAGGIYQQIYEIQSGSSEQEAI